MKTIDRLLFKATGGRKKWVLIGFVTDHGNNWTATYRFWDGTPGSESEYSGESQHSTCASAVVAIDQAVEAFPYPMEWARIVLDDYGDGSYG